MYLGSKKRGLYSTNKLARQLRGVISLCLLVKGGQNSTPEAQKGDRFHRTCVYLHFNVLSAPPPGYTVELSKILTNTPLSQSLNNWYN